MKYIDEYRDPNAVRALSARIHGTVTRPWVLMEICGGQTHTIMRYGIDELIPGQVELVHGPGCPVCVTPASVVDQAIELASREEVILVSYGDMLRVPGSSSDLFHARAAGADVRVAYTPMDALRLARENPDRNVVFLAIGFETTAPANAMAVWQARREGLRNFSVLASHVLVPPAIRMLLRSPANRVQGFIAPGHVCTITGSRDYEDIVREFRIPIVIAGFEPLDILQAIAMLVDQLESGQCELLNQYARSVSREGNRHAQQVTAEVFEIADRPWRGIGVIPTSGLRLRPEYASYDAERVFDLAPTEMPEPPECIAASVLLGNARPVDCPAFGVRCTPESPLGAPMVSSEGACAAYYRYRRGSNRAAVASNASPS